ncbi:CTP synthase (glutamine hydrolyzing) [Candidatus Woesearchaeota archaeon]|nr:CTP synthase (glutamine hydrolyzing) [Candidatus Woesearchaeota archaeon]
MLQEYGFSVTAVKIDPYMNYDAGTLRPTEHGEVWVTDDGGEIDQDLGNYERFFCTDIPKRNNITTGQIYKTIIDNERAGKYLGETVQFIPHVPDEIKRRIKAAAEGFDFCLVEVGGTIGDFENIAYLFALKSLEREIGKDNITYILITYLPIPSHIEEMKTKPTQQAIRLLSENGIWPDFIICRAKKPLDDVRKKKIEMMANIRRENIISEPDIDTIYRIPLDLEKEGLGKKLLEELKVKAKKEPEWKSWKVLVEALVDGKKEVNIAIVGKYVDIGDYSLADSYMSINQALAHSAANLRVRLKITWVDSKRFEKHPEELKELSQFNGIIVPGGFGSSGVEGKIKAIQYAREHDIPYLGLCYGMQLATIEYARNVCGMGDANTTEIDPKTEHPVITILESQKKILEQSQLGGTMRLGAYAAALQEGSVIQKLYKEKRIERDADRVKELRKDRQQAFRLGEFGPKDIIVVERHRHRYEVNPLFIERLEKGGFVFSGFHLRSDGTKLMEFMELPKHKYFVGTQSHPEFKSNLEDPAPLFLGLIRAGMK